MHKIFVFFICACLCVSCAQAQENTPKSDAGDFTSLLKTLSPDENETSKPAKSDSNPIIESDFSDEDKLHRNVAKCWKHDREYPEGLIVELMVYINPDMTVKEVSVIDQKRYKKDKVFRSAADTAKAALLDPGCKMLSLPPEKYEQWKVFKYNFAPSVKL